MRRLYQKIYLTIIASLLLVVLVAGLAWRLGGDRMPAGIHQEIQQHAISGLVDPCGILSGECADGLLEFLTRGRQNVDGMLALGRIRCGEKARRGGSDFTGGPHDFGSARDLG